MGEPTLVERLRALIRSGNFQAGVLDDLNDAADRITALEAERDALRQALKHAAQFIKDWDDGDPNTADGWSFDEFLAEWTLIQRVLAPSPDPEHTEIASEMGSGEHLPGWVKGDTP